MEAMDLYVYVACRGMIVLHSIVSYYIVYDNMFVACWRGLGFFLLGA